MKIMKVRGITLSIHFLFFPIMILLYLLGYGEKMLLLLGIILMHEFSHGLTAKLFGIKIKEIQILPFGGVVKLDKTLKFTSLEEVVISAAGPISNMILSATVFFLQKHLGWNHTNIEFIILSSMVIGVFNLIPALPLDGGRIVRSILSSFISYKTATKIVAFLSKIIAIAFFIINGYMLYMGSYNITLILVGLFIYSKAHKEKEMAVYSTMKDIATKKESLSKLGSMESQHMTVLPQTSLQEIFKQFTPKKFYIIYVLDERYALKGIITEDEILSGILRYGMHSSVKNLLENRSKYWYNKK